VRHNSKNECVIVMAKLNKTDEKIVAALRAEGKELSLQELSDKTGETSKKTFRSLRKLFENEIVSTQGRKYKLIIVDPKDIKAKLASKPDEEEPE
jgi:DNA-binding Lrp family transcriptional regulator